MVLDDPNPPVGVDGGVVPGGHDLLGLVPGRRDVGVRPGEDRQGRLTVHVPPLRVGPRHVADQGAVRPGCSFEEERQMRGERQTVDLRHEQAEAVLLDEVVQLGQIGFSEGGGDVHREILGSGAALRRCALGCSIHTRRRICSVENRPRQGRKADAAPVGSVGLTLIGADRR